MPTNLSIIITHYQTPELLNLCIDSIKKDCEIIVVDSESKKELELDNVQVLSFKKNLGYTKSVNKGLETAKGKYILILNADIIILNNSIEKMMTYMDKNPDIGILGPQLIDFTNNIQESCFSKPTIKSIILRRTFLGKTRYGKEKLKEFVLNKKEVDWIQGSALMVRKKAMDKVGILDERFKMYHSDSDWCKRFWDNNYKVIYYPKAKMAHYYHRSSKKWGAVLDVFLNKHARTHIFDALKYFWKWR